MFPTNKKISLYTATAIVIANMVGTGVFTSLGFQAASLNNGFSILLLWILGAVVAFTGALCYGELGAIYPRSGGEYVYLSKIYHPAIGFAAGWVSLTVGFAAPVAAAAIALGKYTKYVLPGFNEIWVGSFVVIAISIIHAISLSAGSKLQNYSTTFKVIAIIVLILFGLLSPSDGNVNLSYNSSVLNDVTSSAFATSFFFVTLAYSGWNAAGYIASEIDNPIKNLPKALLFGTLLVAVLYIGLNYVFLKTIPLIEMTDSNGPVVDIAGVSAKHIFGVAGGKMMSTLIALLLISTISAMILAGPRVGQTMGEDNKLFKLLSKKNKNGIPIIAIALQAFISLFFIFTSSFEQVIIYISFTLNVFTFLAVAGVIVLKIRGKKLAEAYQVNSYLFIPIVFLTITGWLSYVGFMANKKESLLGIATALSGMVIYFLTKTKKKKIQLE